MTVSFGEFQITEVNQWTQTPISADISTFSIPFLTYILIEIHIKGVPSISSEEDSVLRVGYIQIFIRVEEILVPQTASKLGGICKIFFPRGLDVEKACI